MKTQLHKLRLVLIIRPSIPIQVEAEVVVVANLVAEHKIYSSTSSSFMIINNNTQVAEVSSEAGGVIEVMEIIKGNKRMDALVTTVVSLGMYRLIVNDIKNGKLHQSNYASSSKTNEDNERLFVMQQVLNSIYDDVAKCGSNVWYVYLGALNNMTSHGEWFQDVHDPEKLGFVETGHDTAHPIAHVGDVPLSMQDGEVKYLADVLHVPQITKNLVSVGQMVEQGLQVCCNLDGCFVEEFNNKCRLVAKGKRSGRLFTLDVNVPKVKAAMFAHGSGVVADTDFLHKRIGRVNMQRLELKQRNYNRAA